MEFIEAERGNQKLKIKLKTICGGQLSGMILFSHFNLFQLLSSDKNILKVTGHGKNS